MRVHGKSLRELSDRELEEELERRRARRAHESPKPESKPLRRRARERPGRERSTRSGRGRSKETPGWKLRQWYRNLELEPGASREEVELAYVRLSEKYHPDRQPDPEKKKVAMQLAGGLREAYRGILDATEEQ